jgi:opacity protein-like surface antigen
MTNEVSLMKRVLLLCTLAAAALFAPSAKADSFTITFTAVDYPGFSGSGVFAGTQTNPGVFDITSVLFGSVTDPGFIGGSSAIIDTSNYLGSDNTLLYPNGGAYFTDSGLSFSLANGDNVNLYEDPTVGPTAFEGSSFGDFPEAVTFTVAPYVAPVPEPGSLMLLGVPALLGAVRLFRRRCV